MENLLALTRSEYGFIGEIRIDAEGNQILRTEAITDISWNEATRDLYEKHAATGMEFRNLDTLFGEVIKTSKPVIANDPSSDPRSAGIPEGHPPLNAFLGVPVFNGEKLIGMYGVANRPGGYDLDLVEYLEPFSTACGSMIESLRNLEQKRHAEKKLRQLSYGIESAGEAIVITDKDAVIQYVNPEFTRLTGYTEKEAVGQKPSVLKSDRHPREFYEDMWQKITTGRTN